MIKMTCHKNLDLKGGKDKISPFSFFGVTLKLNKNTIITDIL